jgi:hypothetical protein
MDGQYPEDVSLTSQAAHKNFKIAYLDELPDNITLQHTTLKSICCPRLKFSRSG